MLSLKQPVKKDSTGASLAVLWGWGGVAGLYGTKPKKQTKPTKIAHKVSSVGCGVPHLLSQHLGGPHLNQFLVYLAFTFANKGKYYVKCGKTILI